MNNTQSFTEDERYVRTETNELWTGKQVKAHLDMLTAKDGATPRTLEDQTIVIRLRNGKEYFYRRTR